ncbi:MAG: hypothetical protein QXK83_05335 [Zestosphaera sp.]
MPEIACSVCGRRGAFYYRHSSGERLCSRCLEESLTSRIKHSFSGRVRLGREPFITVYIPPDRVVEGAVLTCLLSKIEARFNGRVGVVAPRGVLSAVRELASNALTVGGNVHYRELGGLSAECRCSTGESITNSVRVLEGLSDSQVLQGAQAILLPYTLTDLDEALMEYVIFGSSGAAPADLSGLTIGGTPVVCPFCTVQRVDVMALAYVYGVLRLASESVRVGDEGVCRAYALIKELVSEISLNHPELTHTMLKSRKFFRR